MACDTVSWADPGASPVEGGRWSRTDICPERGVRRLSHIHAPFEARSDEPFWALFQPGLSLVNGWAEHPEEIPRSALIECELKKVRKNEGDWAWAEVEAIQVLPLAALVDRFEATDGAFSPELKYLCAWETTWNDWLLIEGSAEGDLGEWALIHRHPQSDHLVMHGRWDWHLSAVDVGNLRLPPGQADRLRAQMKISPAADGRA